MTTQHSGSPFQVEVPINFWFAKSAPKGRQKRFGGLITTDTRDQQQEIVLQRSLDLEPFKTHGWFNDNHTKDTDGIIGYPDPDSVRLVRKGERLPDGRKSPANGHWAEGYMLDNERGLKIWDTARALHKAGEGRRLGFSIEGAIQKREGKDRKTIAKATVRNVAITNCPVNTDTRMETLAKSLQAIELDGDSDAMWKALGMGTTGGVLSQPASPQTGETAGQVLAVESLDKPLRKPVRSNDGEEEEEEEEKKKSLSDARAIGFVMGRLPTISVETAGRIVAFTRLNKARRASSEEKNMKRYRKSGSKFVEDPKGSWAKTKAGKMEDMGEENEDEEDEGEEEGRKSLSESDLIRTLDEIESLYKAEDPQSRREELLAKAQSGHDLTGDEREELYKSLGGEVARDETPSLATEVIKGFVESEPLQKALDVSEYLDEQHTELVKSLTTLGGAIESEGRRQHEFNLILAKAIHQTGTLIKGMSERLGIIESQPARGPKSKGIPAQGATLEKGFAGAPPASSGDSLSKAEILGAFEDMMKSSNGVAPCGEDILLATAKYEQTNQISPSMVGDVINHRRSSAH